MKHTVFQGLPGQTERDLAEWAIDRISENATPDDVLVHLNHLAEKIRAEIAQVEWEVGSCKEILDNLK